MKKKKLVQTSSRIKFRFDITAMYIVAAIAILAGIGILVYAFVPRGGESSGSILSTPDTVDVEEQSVPPCDTRRVLDGVCVSVGAENPKLIAVMIENHFESWPLSGLSEARVVYEAPVEGNIPRFLALFTADTNVEKVGPVRSARPYYLDWLREYGTPLYAHVGGSDAALSQIRRDGVNDLNEFYRGWYFWRDNTRYAPHNVYTSSELWQGALEQYDEQYTSDTFNGWTFDDVETCSNTCVTSVRITYSGNTYTVRWEYSTSTERYTRYQAGDVQRDRAGAVIEADTIIIQRVDTTVLDGVGRLGMDTVGTGDVTILQKGIRTDGTWEKVSSSARTTFFDEQGTVIPLNPGQIWIQVINRDAIIFE